MVHRLHPDCVSNCVCVLELTASPAKFGAELEAGCEKTLTLRVWVGKGKGKCGQVEKGS